MNKFNEVEHLDLVSIDTLVFAGGGNRCWWQAGLITHLLDKGWTLPGQLVGTSAGAAVAASFITESPKVALDACIRLYAENERILHFKKAKRFKLAFAHEHIYPAWIDVLLNKGNFDAMRRSSTQLRVGFTLPAKLLGLTGSVVAGTLAYIVDRYVWNSIHPQLPKIVGLKQGFLCLNQCQTIDEAQGLLAAAAAAPPFMRARRIGDVNVIDGGYIDNAPIHDQTAAEKSKTLVLLTRHYPKLPELFQWCGRTYWQPSFRIPVSTWDCRPKTTVKDAFALGVHDATSALNHRLLRMA